MPSTQESLGLIQQPTGEAGRSEVQGYSVYRELETSLDSMRLCLNLTSHKKKKEQVSLTGQGFERRYCCVTRD